MSDIKKLIKQATENDNEEKMIEKLKQENALLKKKLKKFDAKTNISKIPVEELICIQEINALYEISTKRDLTLEEVRKLDLLIKNLRLIREQSTQVIDLQEIPPDDELLRIASEEHNNEE